MSEVTTNQVAELIAQLAAMTAAASITPQTVAAVLEKMRNLNDQEREKVIAVAEAYIEEIQNTGIPAEKVLMPEDSNALLEFARIATEISKRIEYLELSTFDTTQPLPMAKNYLYNSKPVQSVFGDREEGGVYLAFSIGHENNEGYEAYNHDVMLFLSEASNPNIFMYSSTFNTGEDHLTNDEDSAAMALGAGLATISRAGLMSEQDKVNMNALLTEVFPLVVSIVNSNAGTYEVGSASVGAITPNIQLNITRRGTDVATSADVTTSSGSVSQDKKTITDEPVHSGTKTITVTVVQGGQTKPVSAQWKFLNYLYRGVIDSKPANAAAVKTLIEGSWRNSNKELSSATTKDKTQLAADKYYLFAVKQTAQGSPRTLIVKNASSGGTISVANSDKGSDLQIARVNNSGSDYYSWIIVPSSSNSWFFQITN